MAITPRSIDAGVGIGETFLDKYRVDAILGHGGMGVVAMCTHIALNERVAIKMLRKDVLDDADAVERFMREAQAACKLKSEFVARVSDVGRSDTNVPYMVMEYLEGHDLGNLLDERGSFALPWAVELTLQACEALAEAHSIGIVHRDVKPTNLFVTWRPDGSALIKVLDFGISKAIQTAGSVQLTQTQSLLGTPAYMSPEQMRSAKLVDTRTDIWSLGTVLYELLEGHRPFEAESFSEMCVKVAVDPPQPMVKTPPALQAVVLKCLEKSPDERYASMADLARDLVPFAHDPHQAQVLVERMARMLRRSAVVEWNGDASGSFRHSGSRPIAPLVVEPSGPIAAAAAAVPAPVASPPQVSGPTAVSANQATLPGSHVASPAALAAGAERVQRRPPTRSVTMNVTRPRPSRSRAVAVVALLALAVSIGVIVSLTRNPPAPEQPARIESPKPAPVPPPVHVDPPAPPPVQPAPVQPALVETPPPIKLDKPRDKPTRPHKLVAPAPETAPRIPTAEECDPTAHPHAPPECQLRKKDT